ncbi:hypothetical protein HYH03_012413 [Edaphochlamys debaryana]|uniref:SET domain-containing protein n=1 Tax=Edaphochlamys debaryana TaxID=47281 RepID=A0A835XT40_9CHLO|nr:hypothetical protein HYH03_012413 [Edaphochlamys debaryana]|eukprot:KAG2489187.1 hypothetical protein HYH03_012413 [Edaphochlamys debaryana]
MGQIPDCDELVTSLLEAPLTTPQREALAGLHAGDEELDAGPMDEERLQGIVGVNSFGDEFSDLASAFALPGQPEPVGHLGLWPSFSMLNHSCAANAVNFVLGRSMAVFAARSIPQGSEVLINYLGRSALRPVAERQEALAAGYSFSCDCDRCRAEMLLGVQGHSGPLDCIQKLLSRCDARTEALCQPAPPPPALLEEVRADAAALHAALSGLGPAEAAWLRASCYDLLSQHTAAAEAMGAGGEAEEALGAQLGAVEAVTPHSDLHLFLAVKRLSLLQTRQGPDSQEAQEQMGRCVAAVRGRYGAGLSDGTALRLLQGVVRGLEQVVV